jgi:septal ring factor EnvC (AmiA/AmiB activator)
MGTQAILNKRLAAIETRIGAKQSMLRGLRKQAKRIEAEIADLGAERTAIAGDLDKLYPEQAA